LFFQFSRTAMAFCLRRSRTTKEADMPAPGKISTYFEFDLPAGTPATLRTKLVDDVTSLIDSLVVASVRKSWLDKAYSGGTDRSDLCSFGDGEIGAANSTLSMDSSVAGVDSYCNPGERVICYTIGKLLQNGNPVTVSSTDPFGNSETVTLLVIVAYGLPE